jgi:hypothetical protein
MVISTGVAKFRVRNSGAIIEVRGGDLSWGTEFEEERSMGPEVVHSAEWELGNEEVAWMLWEYPPGAESHREVKVPDGYELIQDIEYGLAQRPE